ncbi:NAD(P)/FAD-dependent oxidoreductase [Nonomuraea maheshkhaliensis]|uniref:NAD(P)/FAD-dependent oxidoreductase n=1 Tax=Nonomuraea maheshkhaliensis TaxID=419590 RepID=A0ABN2EQM7_9ACTN
MSARLKHVAVIGGGIGGLCLAQGLRQAGIPVTVYERDRSADSRLQGFRLNIEPTGSTALHACLPPALWEVLVATAGDPGPGISFRDERMRPLVRIGRDGGRKPDPLDPTAGRHAVSRVTLRKILLAGLDDVVRFGKECTGFSRTGDGTVSAEFADGTTATADVLVAADGAGSRVWGQLRPEAGRTTLPATAVAGKLFLTEANRRWLPEPLLAGMNAFWPRQDFLFTAVFRRRENPAAINARLGDRLRALGLEPERLLADSHDDDYILWAFIAHRDALPGFTAKDQADPVAVREMLARRTTGWHPDLRRLLADSTPDTLYQTEFRAAQPLRPDETGNVTGLGDAVHQMPPVGGLGGNTALRDAHRLRTALIAADRGEQPLARALHDYETDMLRHGFDTVRAVVRNTDAAIDRNPLRRAATRWFFRTCGAVPPLGRAVFGEG